jgi:hypothetical protein
MTSSDLNRWRDFQSAVPVEGANSEGTMNLE